MIKYVITGAVSAGGGVLLWVGYHKLSDRMFLSECKDVKDGPGSVASKMEQLTTLYRKRDKKMPPRVARAMATLFLDLDEDEFLNHLTLLQEQVEKKVNKALGAPKRKTASAPKRKALAARTAKKPAKKPAKKATKKATKKRAA